MGDILPSLPPALKARLFAAFGLEILWNKPGHQATVFVEITENTLQAIPGITDPGQDGYHDTSPETSTDDTAPMWDLGNTPRRGTVPQPCPMMRGARRYARAPVVPAGLERRRVRAAGPAPPRPAC